jgi:gliding motility-associated-like protein
MRKLPYKKVLICFIASLYSSLCLSQNCPANIGFEKGSFANWKCYSGGVDSTGYIHLGITSPTAAVHEIIGRDSANALDLYGEFPKLCPNGSGYSIKLGNEMPGAYAEGVSYTFTVPANASEYSIIYNYAVVLQSPGHLPHQQPKFTAKVYDVTSDAYIECSSFEFVASSTLPGFYNSLKYPGVICKAWSGVTIDLIGYAGKELRLEFTNNDCSLGAHFGYVYIDVNENCKAPVTGGSICPNDTSITLQAPFGFSSYNWYDANFTTLVGTGNKLVLNPLPPANTIYAVEVIPYAGLGCRDTIYTTVKIVNDLLDLHLKDSVEACIGIGADITKADITSGTSSNLTLTYHTDADGRNFLGNPAKIISPGTYYIRGTTENGCKTVKPIIVKLKDPPNIVVHHPTPVIFPVSVDLTITDITLGSDAGLQFTYWQDSITTKPLPQPTSVERSGRYFIKGTSLLGCMNIKPVIVVVSPPLAYGLNVPNAFSPNGDGINDKFIISIKGEMQATQLYIYNRWGNLMYASNDVLKGWDGKYKGKELPVDAYYWTIEGKELYLDQKIIHKGVVIIVK